MDPNPQDSIAYPSNQGSASERPSPQQLQPLAQFSQLSLSQSSPLLAQQQADPSLPVPPPLASSASFPSLPAPSSAQPSTPDHVAASATTETHPIQLPYQDTVTHSSSSSSPSSRPQSHLEPRQRGPPLHPLRPALFSSRSRNTGPASASPSTWSISSSDTGPSSASSVVESKVRFERLPNGQHRHNLCAPKRQQFLSNQVRRLRELLDGKKEREDPQQLLNGSSQGHLPQVYPHPLSLLNEKCQDLDINNSNSSNHSNSNEQHSPSGTGRRRSSLRADFEQKYGELQQVVGKGAFGTVRLSVKRNPETGEEHVFAIKEFKYASGETQKQYMRRLTSEFCIASSLRHMNIILTMDLLQLQGETYSEVMEYCSGGDMHSLIASANYLGESESNCFFAQLMNGVAFLHAMGVVHRDLKPENLLLTADGCVKIADFGNSEVFRMPWEKKVRPSASIRGSGPFIAPEEFTEKTFDARKVDMWSCGIIYMCMRLGRYTWHEASDGDPIWDGYLYRRTRYLEMKEAHQEDPPVPDHINLTSLEQASHTSLCWPSYIEDVIEHLLEPDTRKRWQANKVLDSEWFKHIENCHPAERQPDQVLDESDFETASVAVPSQRVGSKVISQDASVTGCKIVKEARDRRPIGDDGRTVAPAS